MSWNTVESAPQLKPFTLHLLQHPDTGWQYDTAFPDRLQWDDILGDADVLLELLRLVWSTKEVAQEQYLTSVHDRAVALLEKTHIFSRLHDPHIQVTAGHNGVRPSVHTCAVAEILETTALALKPHQVFVLRFAAYVHDLGKGVSAGIAEQEILQLMRKFEHERHSFPAHEDVSYLILQRIGASAAGAEMRKIIGEDTWKILLLVVKNHHVFEEKSGGFEALVADFDEQMPTLLADPEQLEAILLTYAFMFADIHATEKYRKYWPKKIEVLLAILQKHESMLSASLQLLAENTMIGLQQQYAVLKASATKQKELPQY